VHLIGCNAQNSAGQLRGVLSALNELGLTESIVMASIGNGHSSAVMDLTNRKAFVGFG